jgi:NADH-quinone oxidoreductase subunit J
MNTGWVKDAIFLFFVAWTLIMAAMTVGLSNIFHNALSFVGAMFGVAVIFLFLNSEFLAVVEVLIYVGAVAVLIVFAIMLSPPIYEPEPRRRAAKVFLASLVSLASFGLLLFVMLSTRWTPAPARTEDFSVKHVGLLLLRDYALPFEIISVVLLVAIIGAIMIAGRWELQGRQSRGPGTPR